MTKQYLSCAETAKLVRAALKESFPGIKFSVKSSVYSGGASINVSYENGPTVAQVKAVVNMFEGAYFDGMTDYKGYNYYTMGGVEVSFGANFIFVNRKMTKGFLEGLCRPLANTTVMQCPKLLIVVLAHTSHGVWILTSKDESCKKFKTSVCATRCPARLWLV
jgi:hypothetical protein